MTRTMKSIVGICMTLSLVLLFCFVNHSVALKHEKVEENNVETYR